MSSSASRQQASNEAFKKNSRSRAELGAHDGNQALAKFVDNRSQTVTQLQLQTIAANSPHGTQLQALSRMAQHSDHAAQLKEAAALMHGTAQREVKEEDEVRQKKSIETANGTTQFVAPKPNHTGLPDNLKSNIESLGGMSMDHVRVHYNSSLPAQLSAHAYAKDSEIHVAPGQERHLPHEAWHVVQQAQGRVRPTVQMAGIAVNDDASLESEADTMGMKAAGTVQLRKTTKPTALPEQQALVTDIGSKVKQNVLVGKATIPEKSDAIWTEAVRAYDFNEGKGEGYARDVTNAVANYKNTTVAPSETKSPKQKLIEENAVKRTGYDSKFSANYANAPIETLSANKYRVNTKGYDPAVTVPAPVVPQGQYEGDYSNEMNLNNGSIKAAWNMAATMSNDDWSVTSIDDEALAAGKGLNNSEILWQQYKLAAEEKHKTAIDKDAQVLTELKNISVIKRDTIINNDTLVTGYMAYGDGEKWNSNKDFTPGSSEFNALLGTPNAKSSAFFLKDHLDQLEKTFDKITATSSGGLDIKFKDI